MPLCRQLRDCHFLRPGRQSLAFITNGSSEAESGGEAQLEATGPNWITHAGCIQNLSLLSGDVCKVQEEDEQEKDRGRKGNKTGNEETSDSEFQSLHIMATFQRRRIYIVLYTTTKPTRGHDDDDPQSQINIEQQAPHALCVISYIDRSRPRPLKRKVFLVRACMSYNIIKAADSGERTSLECVGDIFLFAFDDPCVKHSYDQITRGRENEPRKHTLPILRVIPSSRKSVLAAAAAVAAALGSGQASAEPAKPPPSQSFAREHLSNYPYVPTRCLRSRVSSACAELAAVVVHNSLWPY
uniref:Uncharacterized protein n=1 Tax=Trichogramma kaykai TaxID=54128 RepID=A0ABD2WF92_9HYME